MLKQIAVAAALLMAGTAFSLKQTVAEDFSRSGVVKVRSVHSLPDTVERIKQDVAAKGIKLFATIDQAQLAADAGIVLRPSTLIVFGNPPLGAQFLTSNPYSGLDWPVRVLVLQEDDGSVWVAWTDFAWIARRHGIADRQQQFAMATSVVESITSTVRSK
jgi:uncharacterized protein (DUF302 family)